VSGQATAAAPAVRASGAAVPTRPLSPQPRPRRVSGPARRKADEGRVGGRSKGETGLAVGLLARLDALSRHRALGGRTWIGLVAFALIGIVTLQLGLLKLNAGIGRALEHEAVLQRENAALSIENSEMGTSARITSWAAREGMEPVPMGALRFLEVRPLIDVARGAAALSGSAHAAAAGSAEASGAGSSQAAATSASAGPAEQSSAQAASTSTSIEPAAAGSTPTAGEPSVAASSPASSSDETSPGSSQGTATPAAESTTSSAPPTSAGAGSSSGEGAPGGGIRASPAG
jgi:hypothetical protein